MRKKPYNINKQKETDYFVVKIEKEMPDMRGKFINAKTYSKPNMANLHGRIGEQILKTLRQQSVKSDDNIRKVADECKARILAGRSNG